MFSANEHVNRMNIVEMDAKVFLFFPVKTRIFRPKLFSGNRLFSQASTSPNGWEAMSGK
jgi:hypothetical protein